MLSTKLKKSVATKREKLEEFVGDSTERIRHLFFFYLASLIYVLTLVFSTTDKMLLLVNDGLKLPIIDFDVPLVGFYMVIPLFVIAIHIHLLINLESHHNKLMKWQQACGGSIARENIHLLLFNLSVLDKEGSLKPWVSLASSVFYIYLGSFTLVIIFWRFADYQSGYISLFHLSLFIIDIYLVRKVNQTFINSSSTTMRSKIEWITKIIWALIALLITVKVIVVSWVDFSEDNTFAQQSEWIEKEYDCLLWFVPNIEISIGENLLPPDNKPSELELSVLSKEDPVLYHFNRRDISIHLIERSLRMVFLGSAVIPRTDFTKARLQGAKLLLAHLEHSNFSDAGLQNANLESAYLEGADFRGSYLEGADFRGSQLQYTNFGGSNLPALSKSIRWESANLLGANMQETDLKQALSQGAVQTKVE